MQGFWTIDVCTVVYLCMYAQYHYVLMYYGVRSDDCLNTYIHTYIHTALHHILKQSAQLRVAQDYLPISPADVT